MNYGELKARIQGSVQESYSHRNDLSFIVEDFINQARERIGSELRSRSNRTRTTLVVTNGSASLPTGLQKVRQLLDPDGFPLRPVGIDELASFQQASAGGTAYVYATTDLFIEIAPQITGTFTIDYYRSDAAFVSDSQTVNNPALYIFASMVELGLFTSDDGRVATYEALYQERLRLLNKAHRMETRATASRKNDYSVRSIGL